MTCCIIRDTIFIFWRRRNEWQSSQWHFLETSLVFDMNVHICKYLLLATSNIQPLWYFNKTIHFIRYGKWNSAFSIHFIIVSFQLTRFLRSNQLQLNANKKMPLNAIKSIKSFCKLFTGCHWNAKKRFRFYFGSLVVIRLIKP